MWWTWPGAGVPVGGFAVDQVRDGGLRLVTASYSGLFTFTFNFWSSGAREGWRRAPEALVPALPARKPGRRDWSPAARRFLAVRDLGPAVEPFRASFSSGPTVARRGR